MRRGQSTLFMMLLGFRGYHTLDDPFIKKCQNLLLSLYSRALGFCESWPLSLCKWVSSHFAGPSERRSEKAVGAASMPPGSWTLRFRVQGFAGLGLLGLLAFWDSAEQLEALQPRLLPLTSKDQDPTMNETH